MTTTTTIHYKFWSLKEVLRYQAPVAQGSGSAGCRVSEIVAHIAERHHIDLKYARIEIRHAQTGQVLRDDERLPGQSAVVVRRRPRIDTPDLEAHGGIVVR